MYLRWIWFDISQDGTSYIFSGQLIPSSANRSRSCLIWSPILLWGFEFDVELTKTGLHRPDLEEEWICWSQFQPWVVGSPKIHPAHKHWSCSPCPSCPQESDGVPVPNNTDQMHKGGVSHVQWSEAAVSKFPSSESRYPSSLGLSSHRRSQIGMPTLSLSQHTWNGHC